jgi:hypothetical protein
VIYEDKQGAIWVGTGAPFADEDPDKKGGLTVLTEHRHIYLLSS